MSDILHLNYIIFLIVECILKPQTIVFTIVKFLGNNNTKMT